MFQLSPLNGKKKKIPKEDLLKAKECHILMLNMPLTSHNVIACPADKNLLGCSEKTKKENFVRFRKPTNIMFIYRRGFWEGVKNKGQT
jgi:hypothetical protein